jgi:hypothetical protein
MGGLLNRHHQNLRNRLGRLFLSLFDTLNQDGGIILSMSLFLSIILSPLVLEDNDLAVTPLLYNPSTDKYILQERMSNFNLILVADKDYLIQRDLATDLSWEFLKLDHCPGFDLILLATRLKHRIHSHILQFISPGRSRPALPDLGATNDKKSGREGRTLQRQQHFSLHGCINSLL